MPYHGFRDPIILFFGIMVVGAIIARNSWRALWDESYDRNSRDMNLYSLVAGLVIILAGAGMMYWWVNLLERSVNH